MPLLKLDKDGNVVEFGFGSEERKAQVTPDEDNVMYGEYDSRSRRARQAAMELRARKQAEAERQVRIKKQYFAEQQAKARAATLKQREIRRQQMADYIAAQNVRYMEAVGDALKNPLDSGFNSQARGDQTSGFKTPAVYVPRKKMGAGPVVGVEDAPNYGNTVLATANFPPRSSFARGKKQRPPRESLRLSRHSSPLEHPMGHRIWTSSSFVSGSKTRSAPMGNFISDIGNFISGALNFANPVSIINTIAPGILPSWADPAQIIAGVPQHLVNNYNSINNALQTTLATGPGVLGISHYMNTIQNLQNSLRQAEVDLKNGIQTAVNAAGALRDAVAGALERNKLAIAQALTMPQGLINDIIKQIPVVKEVYWEADKLTGGTLESYGRSMRLPAKALTGQPISNAEVIEAIINGVKVGAIALAAGEASSIISAASSSLKKGPLGETEVGRKILSLGELYAQSEIAEQGLATALYTQATDQAAAQAGDIAARVGGEGARATVEAAVRAAAASLITPSNVPATATTTSTKQAGAVADAAGKKAVENVVAKAGAQATQAMKDEAEKQAKKLVAAEFQKKTGIPLDLAMQVATTSEVPSAQEIKSRMSSTFENGIDHLKEEYDKIPGQLANADSKMKQILMVKKDALEYEITHRIMNKEYIAKQVEAEVQKVEDQFNAKKNEFMAQLKDFMDLEKQLKELEARAKQGLTDAIAAEIRKKIQELTEKIKAIFDSLNQLIKDVCEEWLRKNRVVNDAATRMLIAEHGGATIYTPSTSGKKTLDYRHPLAVHGLLRW